jgi:hypothetical protein
MRQMPQAHMYLKYIALYCFFSGFWVDEDQKMSGRSICIKKLFGGMMRKKVH